MKSIEVFIHHLNEPQEWLEACQSSLESLTPTTLPATTGKPIGYDMASVISNVLSVKDRPDYIMFADPDNIYSSRIIQSLADQMTDQPIGYTAEATSTLLPRAPQCYQDLSYHPNKHFHLPDLVHSCVLYSVPSIHAVLLRVPNLLDNLAQLHVLAEWYLTLAMVLCSKHKRPASVAYTADIGRIYRMHEGQAHRSNHSDERKLFERFRQELLNS